MRDSKVINMANNKPKQKYSAGQVSATVWENEIVVNGQPKTVLKASIARRYRDNKTGEWKSSQSFSRNEIPLAIYCLQKAFDGIVDNTTQGDAEEADSVE
jgi:hypothetical protein